LNSIRNSAGKIFTQERMKKKFFQGCVKFHSCTSFSKLQLINSFKKVKLIKTGNIVETDNRRFRYKKKQGIKSAVPEGKLTG
jgi:hypothetical protein